MCSKKCLWSTSFLFRQLWYIPFSLFFFCTSFKDLSIESSTDLLSFLFVSYFTKQFYILELIGLLKTWTLWTIFLHQILFVVFTFFVFYIHTHTRTHTLLVCFHFHFVIWKMNEIFPFHNEVLNRNERHQNFNTIQYNILSTQNFYKIAVWTYCDVVLSDSINVHCEGETKGKVKASRWLETQIVMTTYSRRAFRVDEIEWHATPEFSFTTCDQKVRPLTNNLHSLLKYFQILQHYHLSLLCCCYCCMSENDIQRIHGEST